MKLPAPAPTASNLPRTVFVCVCVCVKSKKATESSRNGRKTRTVRSERLSDDGGHCHHFLRQRPAVTLPCVYSLIPQPLRPLSAALFGPDTIEPIRRSLAWICVSVRPRPSALLSSARSRYCAAAAASCLNTSGPLGVCFRFPLPAHDCLTMGGNRS